MPLNQLADDTVKALVGAINADLSDTELEEMRRIVESALARSIDHAAEHHVEATRAWCGAEADIAHKISESIERANTALKANLAALR